MFYFLQSLTSNSISSFPGFLFNFVLYYICLWITCNVFCLNKKSAKHNSNRDEKLSVNVTWQKKFYKENYSLETKNKKISEIIHIDNNNMFSLWLSRLQLQPNSKARMDLHGQCKQLEIVKTDQVLNRFWVDMHILPCFTFRRKGNQWTILNLCSFFFYWETQCPPSLIWVFLESV